MEKSISFCIWALPDEEFKRIVRRITDKRQKHRNNPTISRVKRMIEEGRTIKQVEKETGLSSRTIRRYRSW